MGTVVEKFQYIEGTKQAIKKALKSKGVDVSDTDTFRSYAEKIKEIGSGSGGGSSVAEYFYENKTETVAFPRKLSTESTDYMFIDESLYKASDLEFSCYEPTSSIESMSKFFDGNLATNGNMVSNLYFKFDKPVLLKKLYVYNSGDYEVTLKGTNNPDIATDRYSELWEVIYTGKAEGYDVDLETTQEYQYYCLSKSSGYKTIYELKFYAVVGSVKCTLKSANMTPSFKCFFDDYMQVITQDWHNGSEVIPSQTLTFKPYEDGGCLVNYTDDGKAVNLKLLYLKSNGELVGNIYDNYTIVGGLTTDKGTGIVSGFSNDNKIIIPETVNTDNWHFSIKANYKNTSRHQGLIYDNTRYRGLGEIHDSTQTMSSYITGSWTDGVVPLEDGADYWFLFVVADNTLTSYVKKDNGYKSCPSKEEMEVNFTIPNIISSYGSFIGHEFGIGFADGNEHWESYIDMSTASLVDDGVEVWNAATKVAKKDTYVLAPDDSFELEGYSEKTQVADLNIPERLP